jgi:hypothetical protein
MRPPALGYRENEDVMAFSWRHARDRQAQQRPVMKLADANDLVCNPRAHFGQSPSPYQLFTVFSEVRDRLHSQRSGSDLVGVEGHRWAIEDSFETAKNEFGLVA